MQNRPCSRSILSNAVAGIRKAFTLVELLVVIGIIALLVSILLPSLNRARQQAVSIQCLSNLRQCGQILYFYANQNRGVFPMMFLSESQQLPRNKMLTTTGVTAVNTETDGTKFSYPDVKYCLARIANMHSDPYQSLIPGAPAFDPGGLRVFYCPGLWFWDIEQSGRSHKPEDFMRDGSNDPAINGVPAPIGVIGYWYFGDPDPFYPQDHYQGTYTASTATLPGGAASAGKGGLDWRFWDTNGNGTNRDEYVVRMGERGMERKTLMTDQSRQTGSGNAGSWAGFEFVHGNPRSFSQSWSNELFADSHAESRKARDSSFNGTHTQFINPHPSPDEIQPRWAGTTNYELW